MKNTVQLEIDFTHRAKFQSLRQALIEDARAARMNQGELAQRLDHSPSEFSRQLAAVRRKGEPDLCPDDIEGIFRESGSFNGIYYLIETFIKPQQDQDFQEYQAFKRSISDAERHFNNLKKKLAVNQ